MMTDGNAQPRGKWRPKGLTGAVIIGFFAGLVGYGVGKFAATRSGWDIDTSMLDALGLSGVVALSIGGFYLLVGLVLLAALAAPKVGQGLLTGPNAQDLVDSRSLYLMQTAAVVFLGLALIVLTLSGPNVWLNPVAGGAIFFLLMIAGLTFWMKSLPFMDELMRAASLESAVWTYGFMLAIGGSWAAVGYLGLVRAPYALDWLSLFWGFSLVGSTVAANKRGMLDE
ncbi:hypothetical protein [Erythrobacter sp. EC-HK427]|uniref:hypothetical protein n=1 Tax=Erythrobacter sp. EC-HK427 TaxID=2038396 RepID=UPI001258C095|nr:hypothetical protein [Erythrobacter sp. EC-HK427]VVS97777.1 conserved membrane hypothetical protein [Erythrobacter sp. EC-HK427]